MASSSSPGIAIQNPSTGRNPNMPARTNSTPTGTRIQREDGLRSQPIPLAAQSGNLRCQRSRCRLRCRVFLSMITSDSIAQECRARDERKAYALLQSGGAASARWIKPWPQVRHGAADAESNDALRLHDVTLERRHCWPFDAGSTNRGNRTATAAGDPQPQRRQRRLALIFASAAPPGHSARSSRALNGTAAVSRCACRSGAAGSTYSNPVTISPHA